MSANCQIFFNANSGSVLEEIHTQDLDLNLSHEMVDDGDLIFSNYQCDLSLYKLLDNYAERISSAFVGAYRSIEPHIDFSHNPMLVYDVQSKIGCLGENGILTIMGEAADHDHGYKSLRLIIEDLQTGRSNK